MPSQLAIRALVERLDDDIDVFDACEVLEVFGAWLRRDQWTTQKWLAHEKIHETLVDGLRRFSVQAEFSRLALAVVAQGSFRCIENAGPFCRAGVVPEIFRAMEFHRTDNVVTDMGCESLWRLGERNGGPFIRDAGGAEKLMEILRIKRDNPFLQSNGCQALCHLAEPGCPYLQQFRETAQAAMAFHAGNKPIRRSAEKLIEACDEVDGCSAAHEVHVGNNGSSLTPSQASRILGHDAPGQLQPSQQTVTSRPESMTLAPPSRPLLHEPPGQIQPSQQASARRPESSTVPQPASGDSLSKQDSEHDGLAEWLRAVDDEEHLLQYLGPLRRRCVSALEAVRLYQAPDGVNPRLYEDLGVRKIGHRRLFLVWFRDHGAEYARGRWI